MWMENNIHANVCTTSVTYKAGAVLQNNIVNEVSRGPPVGLLLPATRGPPVTQ